MASCLQVQYIGYCMCALVAVVKYNKSACVFREKKGFEFLLKY